MVHGWLDGRRGLPPHPVDPVGQETGLSTPRIDVLSAQAAELIETERILCGEECALLKREATSFLQRRDALTGEIAVTAAKLAQARSPLTDPEREARRFAERDEQRRPAGLVRARRLAGWERRLAAAEQVHQSVMVRLAEADRETQLREELIEDRAAAARAAARRHHELAMRRIATYLQQLTRTHPHGAELSRLLMRNPVGPDLPEWTRESAAGQSGGT
jgi:hypothetical protein